MIGADVVNPIVVTAFDPSLQLHGFRRAGDRHWVRDGTEHILHVFRLHNLKSLDIVPAWSISVDFVPHVSGNRIRWQQDRSKPSPGLGYDPIDYTRDVHEWSITRLADEAAARDQASAVAARAIPAALGYFATVRDVPDLLAAFEDKRRRPFIRFGFDNYVGEWLPYAYTHAWLHHPVEAREWLEKFLAVERLSDKLRKQLRARLEQMLAP